MTAERGLALIDDAERRELEVLRQTLNPDLNDAELLLFARVCRARGLDPFAGQIVAVKRRTRSGDRVAFQTTIDGFRSIAEDTREYRGSNRPEYGPDCSCSEVPKPHPEWCEVVVRRQTNLIAPIVEQPGIAYWHEFKPNAGTSGEGDVMWRTKPRLMLAKVAEAQALRRAFPKRLAQLYTDDEMQRADSDDSAASIPPPPQTRTLQNLIRERAAQLAPPAPADVPGMTVPAGVEAPEALPEVPESAYAPDAKPIRAMTHYLGDDCPGGHRGELGPDDKPLRPEGER